METHFKKLVEAIRISKFLESVYSKNIKFYYDLTIISGLVCDAKLDLGNKTSK